jgi:TolB-like protein
MAEERIQRRLAAILAADVVGFSRLMGADESRTLTALKSRRKDVLDPLVARYRGRVFKVTGDGVLVEFGSAVNAVQCAVDLQQAMAAANSDQPNDCHIVLRIGVNLGDVMVEGGDLYGDGVNIAARLEAIAEPGDILVSGTAYEHIKSKVNIGFDDLGTRALKNIVEPVRAYRVAGTPRASAAAPKAAAEKPSIAVLPFNNMSGDTEQEYFSDGITEDIITELSRFRSLFVIARNSSFQYRGKSIDIRQVARELGVSYAVEGSIRRAGNHIRITAQLIDATSGNHLWAERYDRDLQDIFAVQDEVVRAIASAVEGRVATSGAELAQRKPPRQMAAYDYMIQGREHANRGDASLAETALRRAIEIDPTYAQAHAWLTLALLAKAISRSDVMFDESGAILDPAIYDEALACGRNAIALDDSNEVAHATLANVYIQCKRHEQAALHLDRASALNPNSFAVAAIRSYLLITLGRAAEALAMLDAALPYDPYPPSGFWEFRGLALYQLRRYENATAEFMKMTPGDHWRHAYLAASYAMAGQSGRATEEMAFYLKKSPRSSLRFWAATETYKDQASLDHLLEGLRKAGLPD